MKKFFVTILLMTNFAFAAEEAPAQEAQKPASNKMTTRDAKKSCKDEGKKGPELIKCMKEKKDEK